MFNIFTLIFNNLKIVIFSVLGIVGLFILRQNKALKAENTAIKEEAKAAESIVKIEEKVINVTNNTTATDLNGNADRMRNNTL